MQIPQDQRQTQKNSHGNGLTNGQLLCISSTFDMKECYPNCPTGSEVFPQISTYCWFLATNPDGTSTARPSAT